MGARIATEGEAGPKFPIRDGGDAVSVAGNGAETETCLQLANGFVTGLANASWSTNKCASLDCSDSP